MKSAQDIILAPVITEKSMSAIALKKYTFKVAKSAGKIEIAKAVEELFDGVKVAKVNTVNVLGRYHMISVFCDVLDGICDCRCAGSNCKSC